MTGDIEMIEAIIRNDIEWSHTPTIRVKGLKVCDLCQVGIGTSEQLVDNHGSKRWITHNHVHKKLYPCHKAIRKEYLEEDVSGGTYKYFRKTETLHPKNICSGCYKKYIGRLPGGEDE